MVGKPLNVAHLHKQWMIDTGFEDVEELVKKVGLLVEISQGADLACRCLLGLGQKIVN